MREYRFQATEETVELLRRLRGAWSGFTATPLGVTVSLADGTGVQVQVRAADVEDAFEAFSIEAVADPEPAPATEAAGDFAAGGNDVVLFTGVAWSEKGAVPTAETVAAGTLKEGSSMHFSGHPGQLSESAEIVCITTDAIVIATTAGTGLLVRTGLKPYSLDVVKDPETISMFLLERGYHAE